MINAEVGIFIESISKAFKLLIDGEKQNCFKKWSDDFNFNYNRKELQKKIDLDIFSKETSIDTVL